MNSAASFGDRVGHDKLRLEKINAVVEKDEVKERAVVEFSNHCGQLFLKHSNAVKPALIVLNHTPGERSMTKAMRSPSGLDTEEAYG